MANTDQYFYDPIVIPTESAMSLSLRFKQADHKLAGEPVHTEGISGDTPTPHSKEQAVPLTDFDHFLSDSSGSCTVCDSQRGGDAHVRALSETSHYYANSQSPSTCRPGFLIPNYGWSCGPSLNAPKLNSGFETNLSETVTPSYTYQPTHTSPSGQHGILFPPCKVPSTHKPPTEQEMDVDSEEESDTDSIDSSLLEPRQHGYDQVCEPHHLEIDLDLVQDILKDASTNRILAENDNPLSWGTTGINHLIDRLTTHVRTILDHHERSKRKAKAHPHSHSEGLSGLHLWDEFHSAHLLLSYDRTGRVNLSSDKVVCLTRTMYMHDHKFSSPCLIYDFLLSIGASSSQDTIYGISNPAQEKDLWKGLEKWRPVTNVWTVEDGSITHHVSRFVRSTLEIRRRLNVQKRKRPQQFDPPQVDGGGVERPSKRMATRTHPQYVHDQYDGASREQTVTTTDTIANKRFSGTEHHLPSLCGSRWDSNGIHWIAFEFLTNGIKMEYTIRCDTDSVDVTQLSSDFKAANWFSHDENACELGWALANMNPCLRGRPNLIQAAVASLQESQRGDESFSSQLSSVEDYHKPPLRQATTTTAPPLEPDYQTQLLMLENQSLCRFTEVVMEQSREKKHKIPHVFSHLSKTTSSSSSSPQARQQPETARRTHPSQPGTERNTTPSSSDLSPLSARSNNVGDEDTPQHPLLPAPHKLAAAPKNQSQHQNPRQPAATSSASLFAGSPIHSYSEQLALLEAQNRQRLLLQKQRQRQQGELEDAASPNQTHCEQRALLEAQNRRRLHIRNQQRHQGKLNDDASLAMLNCRNHVARLPHGSEERQAAMETLRDFTEQCALLKARRQRDEDEAQKVKKGDDYHYHHHHPQQQQQQSDVEPSLRQSQDSSSCVDNGAAATMCCGSGSDETARVATVGGDDNNTSMNHATREEGGHAAQPDSFVVEAQRLRNQQLLAQLDEARVNAYHYHNLAAVATPGEERQVALAGWRHYTEQCDLLKARLDDARKRAEAVPEERVDADLEYYCDNDETEDEGEEEETNSFKPTASSPAQRQQGNDAVATHDNQHRLRTASKPASNQHAHQPQPLPLPSPSRSPIIQPSYAEQLALLEQQNAQRLLLRNQRQAHTTALHWRDQIDRFPSGSEQYQAALANYRFYIKQCDRLTTQRPGEEEGDPGPAVHDEGEKEKEMMGSLKPMIVPAPPPQQQQEEEEHSLQQSASPSSPGSNSSGDGDDYVLVSPGRANSEVVGGGEGEDDMHIVATRDYT